MSGIFDVEDNTKLNHMQSNEIEIDSEQYLKYRTKGRFVKVERKIIFIKLVVSLNFFQW